MVVQNTEEFSSENFAHIVNHYAYDSLHYVLLFPLGNDGCHIGIPHSRGRGNFAALEFYYYRLLIKSGSNHLHLSGRLFHQNIVDMYAKIEQQRLNYIKTVFLHYRHCILIQLKNLSHRICKA